MHDAGLKFRILPVYAGLIYFTKNTASLEKKINNLQPRELSALHKAIPRQDKVTPRPCGLMDKASVSDTGDCKFESCQGRYTFAAKEYLLGFGTAV